MDKCCYCGESFNDMQDEIQHLLDVHGTYCVSGHAGDCNKDCLA